MRAPRLRKHAGREMPVGRASESWSRVVAMSIGRRCARSTTVNNRVSPLSLSIIVGRVGLVWGWASSPTTTETTGFFALRMKAFRCRPPVGLPLADRHRVLDACDDAGVHRQIWTPSKSRSWLRRFLRAA